MLDTNVFNHLVEGKITLSSFDGHRLLVTGVQRAELCATPDDVKRAALCAGVEEVNPELIAASSFAWGIDGAGWNQAFWNDRSDTFKTMLTRFQAIDPKNRKRTLNQLRDIFIAETAMKHGAILISSDEKLRQLVSEFGGSAVAAPVEVSPS
jgi:hypothetical protein